jgi:hypothetical protein
VRHSLRDDVLGRFFLGRLFDFASTCVFVSHKEYFAIGRRA